MSRKIIPLILLIIAGSCDKSDTTSRKDTFTTKNSFNWVTFEYKNVKGYVTRTPWTKDLLVVNDRLSNLVSEEFEIALTPKQEKTLLKILNKANSDSDTSAADCFYPRHGFVFWDSVGRPSAHVSICFECNRLQAQPELNNFDLMELESFCQEIGLPVFDNPLEHEKYFDSLNTTNGR